MLWLLSKGLRIFLWRVGRRLAASYFLIGVLPIPMVVLLILLNLYLLGGYFLGHLYRNARPAIFNRKSSARPTAQLERYEYVGQVPDSKHRLRSRSPTTWMVVAPVATRSCLSTGPSGWRRGKPRRPTDSLPPVSFVARADGTPTMAGTAAEGPAECPGGFRRHHRDRAGQKKRCLGHAAAR